MRRYIRYIVFLVGIVLATLGVTLTVKSDIGTSPWDAIGFGLNNSLGMTTGFWLVIASAFALIIAAVIERRVPQILSFITAMLFGSGVDFWSSILRDLTTTSILNKYLIFFLGIIITSFGVAIYLLPRLPANPIDHLMVTIKEKYNIKVMHAKLLVDSICVFIAIVFSGPIGVGTILATILVGPTVNVFQEIINSRYNIIVGSV